MTASSTAPFWRWRPSFLDTAVPPIGPYTPPAGLDVVYEDQDMAIIHKPAGILSVPGRDPAFADSILTRVRQHHPHAQAVNRLDLPTSGLVVVALRRKAESHLKSQFRQRQVTKAYLAVAAGRVQAPHGHITLPMRCDFPRRPMQTICLQLGKPAWTEFTVLEYFRDATLLLLIPHTGRSHQLRLHLAAIDHPLLGDSFYAPPAVAKAAPRLLLHAAILGLRHPYREQWMCFTAPCPFAPQVRLPMPAPQAGPWMPQEAEMAATSANA
ncbi:pseudouridine synthase [Thermodesulfomicrobium sp. WS]|uniref:RluA family pseudouridine synthase n=1 Tax=Thermodesulfomicrobium sp. WS TaxID=3004129 RepID=UPI002491D2D3|nr:RluA family pseudouridine synthase [Thermodesulfomicrobium sp. WS]BDV01284.1 pseudouridine synthase [Thermodesulfomicrobium sp. WS]